MASSGSSILDRLRRIAQIMGASFGGLMTLGFLRYLIFLIQYKMAQRRSKLPLPPGPTPLPVIGSLPELVKVTGPDGLPLIHRSMMKLCENYPNGIMGCYLGSQYSICLYKPSVVEEALCDHKLSDGQQGHGLNNLERGPFQSKGGRLPPTIDLFTKGGQGIGMSQGNYWKKVRGRLVAHMTNNMVAERNAPMIMEEVNSACWNWKQRILRGEPLSDLGAQLKRESMNMGFRLLLSLRFGADVTEDCRIFQFCADYFFKNMTTSVADVMPALRNLPNPFLKEYKRICDVRDEVTRKFIKQHRDEFDQLRASGKIKDRSMARDICDLFFFDQDEGFDMKDENGNTVREFLTQDQLEICCFDIIFASTDTTAITNEWAIYHLINNPDIQIKLHEELDRVVGPDRQPTLEDRENLPYFWAFLREVFRWCIVAPFAAPHFSTEGFTLRDTTGKEHYIPAATQIFIGAYQMAQDPELWDDPQTFNPERWFTAREEGLDVYGQNRRKNTEHYKFLPFSLGPRMCPGYSLAKVAQYLQTATIIHNFRFKLKKDAEKMLPDRIKNGKLDMTENWGLTMPPFRYGNHGVIEADLRPATRLLRPLYNDIDSSNVFLQGRTEKKIKLVVREQLSHDTALLRFSLGSENSILGLPVGKHIKVHVPNVPGIEQGKWNGREDPEASHAMITRAYTPTSSDRVLGFVDLLVKIYAPQTVARFPDGGKVSYQLGRLSLGDEIAISGPWGLIEYLGKSQFKIGRNHVTKRFVGMMAGGSGITPMLQILVAALEDAEDLTKFSLIYANQTEPDILCRQTLEDLERRFPTRFRLHYTVDRAPEGVSWKYSVGFIDAPMIAEHMPPKGDDSIILACGPPPMIEFACKKNLEKLGYPKDHFVAF